MKALKMRLFQESACYKKPFAFKVWETYPLPPYSTVKGMLHRILNATEYTPMNISIQGEFESLYVNYQRIYFYKGDGVTQMPLKVHELYNVGLLIHVIAEEGVLNRIKEGILQSSEHLSLGRWEDIVRVDRVKLVEVQKVDAGDLEENVVLKYNAYVPKWYMGLVNDKLNGINYRLNHRYKIVNGLREWEKIDAVYVDAGQEIEEGDAWIDEEEDVLFPCISPEEFQSFYLEPGSETYV